MKHVLAAIDFSNVTDKVIHTASKIALAFDADVTVLHAEEPNPEVIGYEAGPQVVRDQLAREIKFHMHKLKTIRAELESKGLKVECLDLEGATVDKIVSASDHLKADLIVIGSHQHGAFHHFLFGSVRNDLIKHSPCPIMIVPERSQS